MEEATNMYRKILCEYLDDTAEAHMHHDFVN